MGNSVSKGGEEIADGRYLSIESRIFTSGDQTFHEKLLQTRRTRIFRPGGPGSSDPENQVLQTRRTRFFRPGGPGSSDPEDQVLQTRRTRFFSSGARVEM
ncbi:unnamed protein product [Pleuronectes platessa]|uniref:Uncharacterized protein n=1 Tax=Pleuronectes platessa TaxID=8262 RepID=A0A9N7UN82_PLEPL|nr:unnamed protein product [Pleuronectes platessa]